MFKQVKWRSSNWKEFLKKCRDCKKEECVRKKKRNNLSQFMIKQFKIRERERGGRGKEREGGEGGLGGESFMFSLIIYRL